MEEADYVYKVLVVGNSGVGKTALLVRYTQGEVVSTFNPTVGIDFKEKILTKHGKHIKLQIWDTAGQERYRTITTAYYRGAMGFILMFDLTSSESFKKIDEWAAPVSEAAPEARVILVGNKSDLTNQRAVTTEQARDKASRIGARYFETSVQENMNIDAAFDALVDEILARFEKHAGEEELYQGQTLTHTDVNNGGTGCAC